MHPKSWPKICLMSWLHDYIRKKYVTCISFAYLGIIFKKIAKKKFFFVFSKFFISDRIFTPKIMTNNLSHVLASWLCTKKVCDMHILCIPRHNFQKKLKKKFFFVFLKFFISDRIYTPKIMTNNLSHVLSSWQYVTGIPFAHQGLQKPHSVVRYPV